MSYQVLDAQRVLEFPLTGVRLIEASAGTGKTYTIANLYLRHVIAVRAVGDLLVVTFTVAATDELRGRIRARLFETLSLLEHDRQTEDAFLTRLIERIQGDGHRELAIKRLRLAVRAMDEAAIYTIHGFCQRALTEFAFNSGQQFHMEVLTDDRALWHQAIQDWWRKTGYPLDRAKARLFSDSLGGLESFASLLQPLLGPQQKKLLPEVECLHAVLSRFEPLSEKLSELAGAWRQDAVVIKQILLGSKGLSRAQTSPYQGGRLERSLAVLDGYFSAHEVLPPPAAFRGLTLQCLQEKRSKKADPALDDPFFAECGLVWQDLQWLQRDLRAAALASAAAYAQSTVRDAKQQAQRLSFDDLLSEMHGALTGENGDALAHALRERFPVAMIDEFQDTDPIQYGIFRRLYRERPECGLIMIGDPKQAIYSFRGGDIFTYMQAKEDLGDGGLYTLDTNWRSTPGIVNAVNTLFRHRTHNAFIYGDAIPFHPARAADREHRYLYRDNRPQPSMQLWTLPVGVNAKGGEKPLSKEQAAELSHGAVAAEIARLIQEGQEQKAYLGDRPLRPGDIAVLVRTSYEAAALRATLGERGVNAVSVERQGVFNTVEATGLELLLQAVLNPRERELARLALTSTLLAKGYPEIERVIQSEDDWVVWVDQLLALHQLWQRKGFMAMFQQLLRALGIGEALGRDPRADRRLTNLLHLGELLQQASKTHAGMSALLGWYRQQRVDTVVEEAELRLESDAELVQIVTIHASKGLEYPVVFVPYLWGCKPRSRDGLLAFHQDKHACLDAGSEDLDTHFYLAEQERLAEDARLAYVALTRAESALYLVWGRAGSKDGHAGQTALAYLLHPHQVSAQLATERPDAFVGLADLRPDLQRLAAQAGGDIRVTPLPEPRAVAALQPIGTPSRLAPRPFLGSIVTDWRINSFSALTRDVHSGPSAPREQVVEDPALQFPAGSHAGSYLHLLLELLDFQGDVAKQVLRHSAEIAPRFNLDHAHWGESAACWLARVIETPLDGQDLTLGDLPLAKRFNELEFDFATRPVDIGLLNRLLQQASEQTLLPLEIETFRGMVNGIIDLVFQHRGRFYIADYKSNFLGGQFGDYVPDRLRSAVYERRYDLQYLLYTLALHRYLRQRLPDYDYARHFGGVYYLFLRGMRPETGSACGVHFDRPELDLVHALDRQVFGHLTVQAPFLKSPLTLRERARERGQMSWGTERLPDTDSGDVP